MQLEVHTMGNIMLPNADAVTKMLESLLGRDVFVVAGGPAEAGWAGRYVTRGDVLAAVGVADVRLVSLAGSALSMVPPGTAKAAADSGDPSEAMLENFHEILNVAASLIIDAGSEHVRLDGIAPANELDEETAAMAATGASRADYTVDIDNYGKASLSFITS
jgi:hypothetical protein